MWKNLRNDALLSKNDRFVRLLESPPLKKLSESSFFSGEGLGFYGKTCVDALPPALHSCLDHTLKIFNPKIATEGEGRKNREDHSLELPITDIQYGKWAAPWVALPDKDPCFMSLLTSLRPGKIDAAVKAFRSCAFRSNQDIPILRFDTAHAAAIDVPIVPPSKEMQIDDVNDIGRITMLWPGNRLVQITVPTRAFEARMAKDLKRRPAQPEYSGNQLSVCAWTKTDSRFPNPVSACWDWWRNYVPSHQGLKLQFISRKSLKKDLGTCWTCHKGSGFVSLHLGPAEIESLFHTAEDRSARQKINAFITRANELGVRPAWRSELDAPYGLDRMAEGDRLERTLENCTSPPSSSQNVHKQLTELGIQPETLLREPLKKALISCANCHSAEAKPPYFPIRFTGARAPGIDTAVHASLASQKMPPEWWDELQRKTLSRKSPEQQKAIKPLIAELLKDCISKSIELQSQDDLLDIVEQGKCDRLSSRVAPVKAPPESVSGGAQ